MVFWRHGSAFQRYTIGNILSVQLYEAACKTHPQIPSEIEYGKFCTLREWLKRQLFRHGRKYRPNELGPGETSLSFFQRVYRSVTQPMSRRMQAAMAALPHEHPKLGAVATVNNRGARIVAWRLKRPPTQPEAEHRDSRRTLGTSLEPFGEHPCS